MGLQDITQAVTGGEEASPDVAARLAELTKKTTDLAEEYGKAENERKAQIKSALDDMTAEFGPMKAAFEEEQQAKSVQAAAEAAAEMREFLAGVRSPAKSIGGTPVLTRGVYREGDFLFGVHEANANDYERQISGKGILKSLAERFDEVQAIAVLEDGTEIPFAKSFTKQDAWGEATMFWGAKATLGTTDATGGWIIPNAIVDEIIKPARVENIYRGICTVVPGVTAAAVDIPFRASLPARALVIAAGNTKTNLDLAYNGYTATMYTLAQIYDIGNQFLRTSRGAAERDVMTELATGFALGEAYYIREGSGSSEPFGYTSALTNGPSAFRTTFTPSATTLAGSIAHSIADAAGALAGRGHSSRDLAAVMSATSYWTMLAQGTDTAGFFFAPANGPEAINAPAGTLITPFGIPVYPDAAADVQATAAVIDNLVVGNWRKFKIYFGQSYRVDSSDQAGTRWDTNLTGFRGEEEMGFDARPAVYSGNFQMITDIVP